MSSKQDKQNQQQFNQILSLLQQSVTQANQPSPYETQLANRQANLQGWLDKRDYRNLPAGVNVDLMPLADAQRMRKMMLGTGGQVAQGANNNDLLRSQRELSGNKWLQDWSSAYEGKVGNLMDTNDSLLNMLSGNAATRSQNNVSNYLGTLGSLASRPKSSPSPWSQLLGGVLGGFAGAI